MKATLNASYYSCMKNNILRLKITLPGILLISICFLFNTAAALDRDDDIKIYFSPNGNCEKAIIKEIGDAKRYIHIAMFNFTNGRIARALVKASKVGVDIKVIVDEKNALDIYSKSRFLKNKEIMVAYRKGLYNNRGDRTGLMHNKFAVIDGKVIVTGSYNWTTSAEKWNYENLLIISSVRVAESFEKEFMKLWIKK
jgi:phosphatidylserine/phosphatidylglycerophosphate/cardiolipin synthase-like enzyme